MSGMVIGDQLFSITQIELLRRLRNSGITREQVIQAFDSFDKLDQELGNLYNVPDNSVSIQRRQRNPPQNHRSSVVSLNGADRNCNSIALNAHANSINRQILSPENNILTESKHRDVKQSTNKLSPHYNGNDNTRRGIKRTMIDLADTSDVDSSTSPSSVPGENTTGSHDIEINDFLRYILFITILSIIVHLPNINNNNR